MFQKRMRISGSIRLEFIAKGALPCNMSIFAPAPHLWFYLVALLLPRYVGRLWELSFAVTKDHDWRLGFQSIKIGRWVVRLALLSQSPPTAIDSRLVIEDPRSRSPDALQQLASYTGLPTSLFEAVMAGDDESATPASPSSPSTSASTSASTSQTRPKPRIELRLKSREQLTAPKRWEPSSQVVVALEESALANSLQFKYVDLVCPLSSASGELIFFHSSSGCPYLEADGSLIARLEAKLGPPDSDCVIC